MLVKAGVTMRRLFIGLMLVLVSISAWAEWTEAAKSEN